MSFSSSRAERKRLLPGAFEAGLKRLAWFCVGASLVLLALAGWLSLATWSIHDPSLNHATRGAPENLFAYWGAVTADLTIQSLGLAAIALFLPLAAWGRHIMVNAVPAHARLRLLAWPFAALLIAGGLSSLPVPGSWPLPNGLGGIMGDLILAAVQLFLAPVPESLVHMLAALAFLFTGGWAVLYASAVPPAALRRMWGIRRERTVAAVSAVGSAAGRGVLRLREIAETFAPASREADDPEETIAPHAGTETPALRPLAEAAVDPSGRIEPYFESALPAADRWSGDEHDDDEAGEYRITRLSDDADTATSQRSPAGILRADAATPRAYALPPLRLLRKPPSTRRETAMSDDQLQENARLLEEVLQDFGVKGEIINVRPGPVVTLYELEPAPGTKSSRVIGLADDIARSMSAVAARVAVVPGRNAIGIELPNEQRQMVFLRELLEAEDFRMSEAELGLALGKNIGGEPVTVDLARMPHLLIAGTTGSGKSVGINTMILSLLYSYTPDECKFIMIDPKMLELSVYDGIPHLLSPVVTDPKKAVVALKWTVKEMEERYKRMSKLGVRNIHGYNARVSEARNRGETIVRTVQTGFDRETGEAIYEQEEMDYEPMPYIVVIVDEMADLMMVAGKDIEGAVQRLAQMARAAGIHLITATQRPSVDVVTGTIKANFPTRVSFQVTSKVDSRTILGEQGAEQLLGQGDMLYMAGGGRIMRVHGPFVSDDEVEKIVRFLKKQGAPQYLEEVTNEDEDMDIYGGNDPEGSGDELFDQAVGIVIRDQKASTSYIQRRLSIGYNRAATLIERMEEEGIVSPANHAGKREILVGTNS